MPRNLRTTAAWRISIWTTLAFALGTAVAFSIVYFLVAQGLRERSDTWLSGEAEVLAQVSVDTPSDHLYKRIVREVAELATQEVPDELHMDRAPVDFSDVVRQLVDIYQPAMSERYHEVMIDLEKQYLAAFCRATHRNARPIGGLIGIGNCGYLDRVRATNRVHTGRRIGSGSRRGSAVQGRIPSPISRNPVRPYRRDPLAISAYRFSRILFALATLICAHVFSVAWHSAPGVHRGVTPSLPMVSGRQFKPC